jgi:hypothetical protein
MDDNIDEPRIENQPALEGEIVEQQTHSRVVELRTVERVMEDSYLRYSMSVIIDRANEPRWFAGGRQTP